MYFDSSKYFMPSNWFYIKKNMHRWQRFHQVFVYEKQFSNFETKKVYYWHAPGAVKKEERSRKIPFQINSSVIFQFLGNLYTNIVVVRVVITIFCGNVNATPPIYESFGTLIPNMTSIISNSKIIWPHGPLRIFTIALGDQKIQTWEF